MKYGPVIVKRVLRVIDGDTFACDLNWKTPIVGRNISVRLRGFNAAELRTKDPEIKARGVRAQLDLQLLLRTAKKIELFNIERGKYFRLIADVYVDGKSIVPQLQESAAREWVQRH